MRKKVFSLVLFFLAFAIGFSFLNVSSVLAINDPGTGGGGISTGASEVEEVEISLGDKLTLKDGTPVEDVFNSTDDLINLLVKVLFIGAGLVLFVMIVGAGFTMIAGGKDVEKAKSTITSAVVGFIIMFAAYWIMQIIQLLTGLDLGF